MGYVESEVNKMTNFELLRTISEALEELKNDEK